MKSSFSVMLPINWLNYGKTILSMENISKILGLTLSNVIVKCCKAYSFIISNAVMLYKLKHTSVKTFVRKIFENYLYFS